VAVLTHQSGRDAAERLATLEKANLNAQMPPEAARQLALVQYMHEFASQLLEANNRKIAADLVRLGVITGTITRSGEAAF
jgi:hypothetical protein